MVHQGLLAPQSLYMKRHFEGASGIFRHAQIIQICFKFQLIKSGPEEGPEHKHRRKHRDETNQTETGLAMVYLFTL